LIQPCSVVISKDEEKLTSSHCVNAKKNICGQYNCFYCEEQFSSKVYLRMHVNSCHKDIETFWCRACVVFFDKQDEKEDHFFKVHRFHCLFCKEIFSGGTLLRKHIMETHKREVIQCKYTNKCAVIFKNRTELDEHVKKEHEQSEENKRKCVYCTKWIIKRDIWKHVIIHHKSKIIKCDYRCSTFFTSEEEKRKHELDVHETGMNRRNCVFCRKKIISSKFTAHMQRFHKPEAIKCNFKVNCPAYFFSEEEKQEHILTVHKIAKFRALMKCIYCKAFFAHNMALKEHIKIRHTDIMIKCKYFRCMQFFHTQKDHEKHYQQEHAAKEENKIFKCNLCKYKSGERRHLKHHVAQKHGTKNLKCPKCPKYFKSNFAFQNHLSRTHIEAIVCVYCKLAVKVIGEHQKRDICIFCNELNLCATFRKKHSKTCKSKLSATLGTS